jgi:hypothetical protein
MLATDFGAGEGGIGGPRNKGGDGDRGGDDDDDDGNGAHIGSPRFPPRAREPSFPCYRVTPSFTAAATSAS